MTEHRHYPQFDQYAWDDMVPLDYIPEPELCGICGEEWPCETAKADFDRFENG